MLEHHLKQPINKGLLNLYRKDYVFYGTCTAPETIWPGPSLVTMRANVSLSTLQSRAETIEQGCTIS